MVQSVSVLPIYLLKCRYKFMVQTGKDIQQLTMVAVGVVTAVIVSVGIPDVGVVLTVAAVPGVPVAGDIVGTAVPQAGRSA